MSTPSCFRVPFLSLLVVLLVNAPTALAADTGPWSLLDSSTVISDPAANDASRVEVGTRFSVSEPAAGAYWVKKVRFYRSSAHPMIDNRVFVYDAAGSVVGQGVFVGEGGPSGVVDVQLQAPVKLTPGVRYTASYVAEGYYALERDAFTQVRSAGPVRFPVDAGVYKYGGGFPAESWRASNYYVGPVVTLDESTPGDDPAPSADGPWSLLDGDTEIADPAADDGANVEVGAQFSVGDAPSGAYVVRSVRFYRAPSHPMTTNRVFVYDEDGKLAGRGTFIGEGGPSGVVQVDLETPLTLRSGVRYTASYLAEGHYAEEQHAFDEPQSAGPVTFPADAGVYRYGGGFPAESWHSAGYYVSPVVSLDEDAAPPPAPSPGPWSLVDSSTAISDPAADDASRVEVGARFSVPDPAAGAYWVRKVRFFRSAAHPMINNRVFLYDAAGTAVGQGLFVGEGGPSGVVDVELQAPVKLTPGMRYTASYVAEGYYALERDAFTQARSAGPVKFPVDAGVYKYGGGFPTESWRSSSYYVSPAVTLE